MHPQNFAKPLFISHKYPTIPFPFPSISAPSQTLQWEAPHRLRLMGFFPSLLKFEGEVVVRISVVGLLNKGSVTVEASRQPLWQSALFISNQINHIAEEPTYRGRFCHVPRRECARMYRAHVEAGPTPPASPSPLVVLGPTSIHPSLRLSNDNLHRQGRIFGIPTVFFRLALDNGNKVA
jgi:hypothetical protein